MKAFFASLLAVFLGLGMGIILLGCYMEEAAAKRAAAPKPAVQAPPPPRFVRESFSMVGSEVQRWVEVLRDTQTGQHYVAYAAHTASGTSVCIIPMPPTTTP